MLNQCVLPVLKDWKQFEGFLKSECTWGILMEFHINFLDDLIKQAHEHKKKVIVHMDLIHGLSNDSYGVQFVIQKLHCDGIISTKPKVIACAKSNHCLSILRLFLIDSTSLKKGCAMANTVMPDYLEVLPALTLHAVERIREVCELPLIGGGLIQTKADINQCIESGMTAVSTSDLSLCSSYLKGLR